MLVSSLIAIYSFQGKSDQLLEGLIDKGDHVLTPAFRALIQCVFLDLVFEWVLQSFMSHEKTKKVHLASPESIPGCT